MQKDLNLALVLVGLLACGHERANTELTATKSVGDPWKYQQCAEGRHWTRIPTPTGFALRDVWRDSKGALWVRDAANRTLVFDGSAWQFSAGSQRAARAQSRLPPNPPIVVNAQTSSTTGEVIAVGAEGKIAIHANGRWERMDSGSSADLHAVWAGTDGESVAVGDAGTALHYRCGNVQPPDELRDTPSCATAYGVPIAQRELYALWGTTAQDFYVAGAQGLWHVVAGQARSIFQQRRTSLEGIWGEGDHVVAVGTDRDSQRMLAVDCRADHCTPTLLPDTGVLRAVAKTDRGWVAVGNDLARPSRGVVKRYAGGSWRSVGEPVDVLLSDVQPSNDGKLWIVGTRWQDAGVATVTGMVYTLDGTRLVHQFSAESEPLVAAGLDADGQLLAAGGHAKRRAGGASMIVRKGASGFGVQRGSGSMLRVSGVAAYGEELVAASTWAGAAARSVQHVVARLGSAPEQARVLCTASKPLQRVARLGDGAVGVVGDDGIAFVIPAEHTANALSPQRVGSSRRIGG